MSLAFGTIWCNSQQSLWEGMGEITWVWGGLEWQILLKASFPDRDINLVCETGAQESSIASAIPYMSKGSGDQCKLNLDKTRISQKCFEFMKRDVSREEEACLDRHLKIECWSNLKKRNTRANEDFSFKLKLEHSNIFLFSGYRISCHFLKKLQKEKTSCSLWLWWLYPIP